MKETIKIYCKRCCSEWIETYKNLQDKVYICTLCEFETWKEGFDFSNKILDSWE